MGPGRCAAGRPGRPPDRPGGALHRSVDPRVPALPAQGQYLRRKLGKTRYDLTQSTVISRLMDFQRRPRWMVPRTIDGVGSAGTNALSTSFFEADSNGDFH